MRTSYKITKDIIENLENEVEYEIAQNPICTNDIIDDRLNSLQDDINHQINCEVENACIYYSDCFDIVKELGVTDWEDLALEYGSPITSICNLAMFALIQEIYERFESDIYDAMILYYESLRTNEQIEF